MADDKTTIEDLKQLVENFVNQRNWQQFHAPKNLAMSLAIEAAELMEHFQWIDAEESRRLADDQQRRAEVADELSDVLCYALAMANTLKIDLADAIRAKMVKNEQKYPAEQFRNRWR